MSAAQCRNMSKPEIVAALRPWRDAYQALQRCTDQATTLFGRDVCDGAMIDGYVKAYSGWTDSLSALVGDEDRWLHWFAWETDMGQRKTTARAKAPQWKGLRPVHGLEQLADVIIACRRNPATPPAA